ncbi:MAG: myo-inositol-1(or 4)-monophosphatase [Flammeovirgaceae bacterium]|jgi:myo-inositol-1(or 4)-monophosphatase
MTIIESDFSEIQKEVISLSKSVGEFLLGESKKFKRSSIEKKGLNDLVSYVDKEAERQIVTKLKEILPNSGFYAEEGTGEPIENGYNWIIDPLDGTTNFIHGLPHYSTSIALQNSAGELILGVVYEPNSDECFHAVKGEGAFCNETKIQVSEAEKLADGLLATGFPYYDFGKMPAYLDCMSEFMQKCHGLRRFGSAALDLAYVACGRYEGYFEYNLNAWDVAAGILIVREAGGMATKFNNKPDCVFGRELIASNSKIHQEIVQILQDNFYN